MCLVLRSGWHTGARSRSVCVRTGAVGGSTGSWLGFGGGRMEGASGALCKESAGGRMCGIGFPDGDDDVALLL